MTGATLSPEALRASWEALAEPTRAAIVAALVLEADAELSRIDGFYPGSLRDEPRVDVLGVLTDTGGAQHVHFLAHHLSYNYAQSGSDWANHYVLVGVAVLEGATVRAPSLALAVSKNLRESDWESYRSQLAEAAIGAARDATIARLCGLAPPLPETPAAQVPKEAPEWLTIVRCPTCGATDAGATEHVYELSRMTCAACGHEELCDDEQIKDEWNVRYERPQGETTLPAFVTPLASDARGPNGTK